MTGSRVEDLADALRDRYRLERELGHGGMATVWLAHDLRHDRPVALKLLRPELSAALGTDRFLREIRVTANLQHPHILPLLDSGEGAGQCFYVTPYVEGESLRERLRREGPLPLEDALRLTREVADALDCAHERGVVHRDVKPENILLGHPSRLARATGVGHALVADFGIALALSDAGGERLTETGLSLGTPAYMSPEQAMAEPRLDGRSDQYSLACVLYESLAGEPPYTGPTAQAIVSKRLSAPVPSIRHSRPDLPEAVDRALRRAMSLAPADRFASVAEFARSLSEPGTTPVPSRSRGFRWYTLGGTLACILLIVGAWVGLRRRSGHPATAVPRASVAVFPFAVRGNPSLAYLQDGLVELLSAKLDGAGDLRAVDPRALLSLARRRSVEIADPETGRHLADELGAAHYVLGSVLQVGDSLRLTAALYDAAGARQATTDAVATERQLGSAVDDVARSLIGQLSTTPASRLASLGALTTTSFPALRAFLAGQQAFRRNDLDSAITAFRAAVATDSSFALGWYRLGTAAVWNGQEDLWSQAVEQAVRHGDRLSARDRALLAANLSWREGHLNDAEERYRAITAAHPDDVEAWFWLGDVQFHSNAFRGGSPLDAEQAFRRAVALDPEEWQSWLHLDILLRWGRRSGEADSLQLPTISAERIRAFLSQGSPRRLDSVVAEPRPAGWQALAHGLLATDALAGGRWAEANMELDTLERLAPDLGVPYRALMVLNSPVPVTDEEIRSLHERLTRWDDAKPIEHSGSLQRDARAWLDGAQDIAREYLLAWLELRLGQRDEALARASRLAGRPDSPRIGSIAGDLALTIRAMDGWRRGDAGATLRALEAQRFICPDYRFAASPLFAQGEARMLRAAALARVGREEEALGWLHGLQYPEVWAVLGVLVAPAYRLEGEIHEHAGRRPQALQAYREFLDRWRDAGAEAQPQVREVRERVAALVQEGDR